MHRTFSRFAKVGFAMLATTSVVMAGDRIADEKIAVAKASIARAEQSGAPQSAPLELANARDKLARAENANAKHHDKPAAELADQANIDAQVAEATAIQQKSMKAGAEFDKSMQALRQESNRAAQLAQ